MQNLKPLASRCSCAGRFESYQVANPEDRFSCDGAHIEFDILRVLEDNLKIM